MRESEEKFSKVFQDAPVLITVTDLADGTCLDVNAEALNVSGFNREEVVGRTEAELGWITPADRARLLQELREHGRISGLELTFQAKDGHRLFGLVSGEQISIRGRPCLLTVTVDITERQRAEEALQESQALYHSLVEQLPSGVFRKDRAGRYVLVNPEFCRLMGMKAEDFLGKTSQEVAGIEAPKPGATVLATKYAVAGMEHHEQIMQTGKPIETVEEYVHADGRKQFLHVIKLPVVGPEGKILGTQGIQFDITGIKQAEEALEQSARELQERNDELARFTYTASHDLKSPLVTIKAFLGYLEQDTRNQDAAAMKKDLEYIYTAADKMGRLLDELLDLARVGHKMNPPEEVPLQVVVKDALDMVAGWIIQKGVEVVVTKEPIMLCGDRTRLVEVFQNLVDNAIKFMGDQQSPCVEIGVEKTGDEMCLCPRRTAWALTRGISRRSSACSKSMIPERRAGHRSGAGQTDRGGAWRQNLGGIGRSWQGHHVPLHPGKNPTPARPAMTLQLKKFNSAIAQTSSVVARAGIQHRTTNIQTTENWVQC